MLHLKEDNEGFIFSLDATLAVLVALVALAGIASVGNSLAMSEHFGRLRLQRVGQDAIRVLNMEGTFEDAILAMEAADKPRAERIIRENLNKALPDHIQFKLYIRDQLSVFPTDGNEDKWEDLYENAKDRTVTNFLSKVPAKENYFRVLAWTPEPREEDFVDNIQDIRPLWYIKKTTNLESFVDNIEKEDEEGNPFYDAIFIPDADIQFSPGTIQSLIDFAEQHGRLAVAGDTLYNNQNTVNSDAANFTDIFGIRDEDDDPSGHDVRKQDRDDLEYDIRHNYYLGEYFWELKMYVQPVHPASDLDHPILYGFTPIDDLGYAGDNVYTYDDYYDTLIGERSWDWFIPRGGTHEHDSGNDTDCDLDTAKVLTNWGRYPEDQCLDLSGLIVNEPSDWNGVAVFIGANVVQTVNRGASPYKWLRLTANSISGKRGYQLFNEPITLSLWKREEI